MKQLNVYLDDRDYELLKAAKGERTWREFLMTVVIHG